MPIHHRLLFSVALLACSSPLLAVEKVDLDYTVRFLPDSDQAEVRLTLDQGEAVRSLSFNLGKKGYYSDFKTDGTWQLDAAQPGERQNGVWQPGKGKTTLTYRVRINHPRPAAEGKATSFDARMTADWALLRGDDLVPSAKLDQHDGTELVSRLQFELPKGWKSVETGWPRIGKNRFRIDNPSRLLDRPTGWILAGKIGTRRAKLGETEVTVAAPVGAGMRRMDVLTMLTFVWPQVQAVFPRDPAKLLVVGAGNPMWRGGLSASNSLFMHADRPLVSENGTSSLVHELVHVFSRIRDTDQSDWISEGLAEYYAIELVHRAGGMSEERYQAVNTNLKQWSRKVVSLRGNSVSGRTTARAVLLLQDLDREIRKATGNKRSLDDVSRGLMRMDGVSTKDFVSVVEDVMGGASKVLDTPLLKATE
jgi:predicted metalloprotease with PDZ domain